MKFPKILVAAAALAFPASAHAAPPWNAPVSVSSQATAAPHVLFAGGAGTVAFNGTGATFARPVLRAPLDGSAQATEWPGAAGFDTTYGAFAGGERALYVGSNGQERVLVGQAAGPDNQWRTSLRGPKTGGARAAAAPGAAVFSTFGKGSVGYVYLVRQDRARRSARRSGSRRAATSAPSPYRPTRAATSSWSGTAPAQIEARYWYASSERLSAVKELGATDAALKLSASLGDDRRAVVGWIDQRISEGEAAKGSAWATARTATSGLLGAEAARYLRQRTTSPAASA